MAEILWYYARDNRQMGPVSSAELKRLAAVGQLAVDDLIWREGMDEWAPAGRVKGLFPLRDAAAAEPAAPAPPPSPAPAASDVRLAESLAAAAPPAPPEPPAAAAPSPADQPRAEQPPTAAGPAAPRPALLEPVARDPLSPGLRLVLILAQAVLWATCVMVVILGGLMLLGVKSKAGAEQQAVSAAVSCSLFVGSYVLARAGEHVVRLIEEFLRLRQR